MSEVADAPWREIGVIMSPELPESSLHTLAELLVGTEIRSDIFGQGRIEEAVYRDAEPYWWVDFGPSCRVLVMVRACIGNLMEDFNKFMEG